MYLNTLEKHQYSRQIVLDGVGETGQLKLKHSKVLVIGAGGLGCPLLQYMTAAGVGTIGIVDGDTVALSNLQRQILYTHQDIGKNKAEVAAKRLEQGNPFIAFRVYSTPLTPQNALKILADYDVIVDGTDNFPTRYLINDAAVLLHKPIVFGSLFTFEGQVAVFNYKNGPTYRCLYPIPPLPSDAPNCSEVGVMAVLPGIVGSLQANEVLKIILELGCVLSGKLLCFNALSMQQHILSFDKDPSVSIQSLSDNYQSPCNVTNPSKEMSYQEYQKQASKMNTLDVRTAVERQTFSIDSLHIPLNELPQRYREIPQDKPLLVFCKAGIRSKLAIDFLQKEGFTEDLINLKGGLLNGPLLEDGLWTIQ